MHQTLRPAKPWSKQVIEDKGRLDILVNNAAIFVGADLLGTTEDDFDRNAAVNMKGFYFLTQAAAERMGEGGRIVNVGSIFGESAPYPGLGLYAMSKFATAGLTRAWARDLAPKGITVNCIQPGPIDTDMNPEDGDLAEAMLPRRATWPLWPSRGNRRDGRLSGWPQHRQRQRRRPQQ